MLQRNFNAKNLLLRNGHAKNIDLCIDPLRDKGKKDRSNIEFLNFI